MKERSTKNHEPTIISEDEYVELREVGKGSVSSCVLISIIEQLFNRCCDTRPEKRPFIFEIILKFCDHLSLFRLFITKADEKFSLGCIYDEGKYVTRSINKAIYYYTLAANQNFPEAQFVLGCIYDEGKYVATNIDKSIHYFSLAANQNYRDAQYILGLIYSKSKNFDKANHYISQVTFWNNHIYCSLLVFFINIVCIIMKKQFIIIHLHQIKSFPLLNFN